MTDRLISSPLQGFTDYRFRNAVDRFFGGIDLYYAPYIRLNGKLAIKSVYEKDLDPKNNTTIPVVPQVMTCDEDEFLFVIKYVQSLGYNELNWNLGCPYPMVTNRGMGSGLIANPEQIDRILDRAHAESDITISMKMRMGYNHRDEILGAFPVLEKYPIKSVAIHARIGAQLYEGGVDLEGFAQCLNSTSLPIHYNGDITTVETYREMKAQFPSVSNWLLGRGLIADPFLPQMIKNDTAQYPDDRWEVFSKFHDTLFSSYAEKLSGDKHVIMKMHSFWQYFSEPLPDPTWIVKQIKKCKTVEDYDHATMKIFEHVREHETSTM